MKRKGSYVSHKKLLIAAAMLLIVPKSHGLRSWKCQQGKCFKETVPQGENQVSAEECKITCLDHAGLWPRPTGEAKLSKTTVVIDPAATIFRRNELPVETEKLIESAQNIFLGRLHKKSKDGDDDWKSNSNSKLFTVSISFDINDPDVNKFSMHTDESYQLRSMLNDDEQSIEVKVQAKTFFGVRHALETLSQLIVYDDLNRIFKMIDYAEIKDAPAFTHRGIALDTARSYISVPTIKTIIDIMSMNKLNTFHWHITDSQSFPYVSNKYPQLSEEGAYSKLQVYTEEAIRELVEYAASRGIRIIPELDAPAHVGEGWGAISEDLITCFKWEPWRLYCVEPPCGQFDPTKDKLYEILGNIYKEYVDLFPSDVFHMGGDEVNINCWKSTDRIVSWMTKNNYTLDYDGFHKLWAYFQDKAFRELRVLREPSVKPILWSSSLTEVRNVENYLNPEDYIIQIWTDRNDMSIKQLLKKKYRVILSNYDELYLDCGGPSWVGPPGNNWCSPYKSWQIIYNHSLDAIAESSGIPPSEVQKQILGSEAALWTEQIDHSTVLPRLWPRAAALAERLWANPKDDWKEVQFRMNYQRQRIGELYPHTELLQPQWCYQNDGYCD